MTSGLPPEAAAAITPPGTTQCPCTIVASICRASAEVARHAAATASGVAATAAPRSRSSASSAAA